MDSQQGQDKPPEQPHSSTIRRRKKRKQLKEAEEERNRKEEEKREKKKEKERARSKANYRKMKEQAAKAKSSGLPMDPSTPISTRLADGRPMAGLSANHQFLLASGDQTIAGFQQTLETVQSVIEDQTTRWTTVLNNLVDKISCSSESREEFNREIVAFDLNM
jgi:hypothetical protein